MSEQEQGTNRNEEQTGTRSNQELKGNYDQPQPGTGNRTDILNLFLRWLLFGIALHHYAAPFCQAGWPSPNTGLASTCLDRGPSLTDVKLAQIILLLTIQGFGERSKGHQALHAALRCISFRGLYSAVMTCKCHGRSTHFGQGFRALGLCMGQAQEQHYHNGKLHMWDPWVQPTWLVPSPEDVPLAPPTPAPWCFSLLFWSEMVLVLRLDTKLWATECAAAIWPMVSTVKGQKVKG